MHWKRRLALVVGLCVVTSCIGGTAGSGDMVTEERVTGDFDRVDVGDGLNLRVIVGDEESSVRVTFDDNLIDRVETEVEGGTLHIRASGSFNLSGGDDRFIEVTMPEIEAISASGGSNVTGQGSVPVLDLEASGGANVDLALMEVLSMTISASGGANVVVYVTETIEGEASGGANLTIVGNPGAQSIDVSGGASVSNG